MNALNTDFFVGCEFQHKVVFDDFKQYYNFLDGDIYEKSVKRSCKQYSEKVNFGTSFF